MAGASAPAAGPDHLDARILQGLFRHDGYLWGTRRTRIAELAQALGVHRNTVLARMRRLEAMPFFLPVVLDPAPAALGLAGARVLFHRTRRLATPEEREVPFLVEGAKVLHRYPGGWSITVYAEDDETLHLRLRLLERLVGQRVARVEALLPAQPAGSRAPTTPRQREVLAAVAGMPAGRLAASARRLDMGTDALRRQVQALAAKGALAYFPGGDAAPPTPCLGYVGVPLPGEGAARERVLQACAPLPEHVLMRHPASDRLHLFVLWPDPATRRREEAGFRAAFPGPGLEVRSMLTRHLNPGFHPWVRRVVRRGLPDGAS